MKNKIQRRDFPCIFNLQFITASRLVQSHCSAYSSAGNLHGSQLLFLSLHAGRYLDGESVKEK